MRNAVFIILFTLSIPLRITLGLIGFIAGLIVLIPFGIVIDLYRWSLREPPYYDWITAPFDLAISGFGLFTD